MSKITPEEAALKRNFLKQRQSLPLHLKIELSKHRIKQFYEHFDGKVFVSFSGGKDSTVLLHLIRSVFSDVEAVFVDTGLEYPEIKQFVKSRENVTIIRPELQFNKVIESYGYPVISKEVADTIEQSRKVLARNDGTSTVRLSKLNGTLKDKNGNPSIYNCSRWKFLLDAPFKISNKCCEIISLEPMYHLILEEKEKKVEDKKRESIFDMFQKELGRSISPMEYEIINGWLTKGFSEELVLGALKEAIYNGVSSLRYIDRILYEWQKKGYHTMTEVEQGLTNKKSEGNMAFFDYNWLEDEG